jgi:hypothetical protein
MTRHSKYIKFKIWQKKYLSNGKNMLVVTKQFRCKADFHSLSHSLSLSLSLCSPLQPTDSSVRFPMDFLHIPMLLPALPPPPPGQRSVSKQNPLQPPPPPPPGSALLCPAPLSLPTIVSAAPPQQLLECLAGKMWLRPTTTAYVDHDLSPELPDHGHSR